jgi:hypothetical protein
MAQAAPNLLEREAPLQALAAAHERAHNGGRVALVHGEAGVGKTALVSSFTDALGERADVAWGQCDALFTPRVLGPAYDVAARQGGALLEAFDSGASRAAVFAAFLKSMRKGRDPVVVFEDVHWADEATLDLLKYLGRRIGDTRALLILTYRDDEITSSHPLRFVLGELPTGAMQLDRPAVPVAGSRRGAGPRGQGAGQGGACGNRRQPLLRHRGARLGRRHSQQRPRCRSSPASPTGSESPRSRRPRERVSGRLEVEVVERCVDQGAQAIAECEERGMLRLSGGMLRFRHEIARLALLGALGEVHARRLNAQVLTALRAGGEDGDRSRGSPITRRPRARPRPRPDMRSQQARRAATMGAHRQAADHYALALRFGTHLGDAERAALNDDHAWECHVTGRPERIEARRKAISLWAARRQPRTRSRKPVAPCPPAGGAGARCGGRGGDAPGARPGRGDARLLAGGGLSPARLSAHARARRGCSHSRRHKALALAERFGTADDRANVLNSIGSAMLVFRRSARRRVPGTQRGTRHGRGIRLQRRQRVREPRLGERRGAPLRGGLRWLDLGIAWAQKHDLDNAFLYEMSWRALAQLFLGRWSEAAQSAQVVLADPSSTAIARIMALLAVGRLRSRRGDPGAWEVLDDALELAEATETLQRLAPVRAARAEAAWLAGEDAAAAREASAADELARRKRHAWFVGELAYWQWKGGRVVEVPEYAAQPYALQVAGSLA